MRLYDLCAFWPCMLVVSTGGFAGEMIWPMTRFLCLNADISHPPTREAQLPPKATLRNRSLRSLGSIPAVLRPPHTHYHRPCV
jgi:hypothetical protein